MKLPRSIILVCLVTVAMRSVAVPVEKFKPGPGCAKRWSEVAELEASLKGERKVPYDHKGNPLQRCNADQPIVDREIRRTHEPQVAIIVFDVNGSGRVVGQQLIGQKTHWAELSQQSLSRTLFAPNIEDGIGITRVGITMVFIAEFEPSCNKLESPVVYQNYDIRICASR
jgi:hypothetical protein